MWRSVLVNKCADRYLLHRPQIQHFLFTEPAISQILLSLAYIGSPGETCSTQVPAILMRVRPTLGHLAFLGIVEVASKCPLLDEIISTIAFWLFLFLAFTGLGKGYPFG